MIRQTQPKQSRGAAAVEVALVLPLLLLILFATIETCSMIHLQQALKVAAYEGARVALINGTNEGNVQAAAQQVLKDRRVGGGSVNIEPSNYGAAASGTMIQVTVAAPAKGNILVGALFYGGRTLTTKVEMMKET